MTDTPKANKTMPLSGINWSKIPSEAEPGDIFYVSFGEYTIGPNGQKAAPLTFSQRLAAGINWKLANCVERLRDGMFDLSRWIESSAIGLRPLEDRLRGYDD